MKQEMINDLENFGFKIQNSRCTLPIDQDVVLIRVKTRNQFRECLRNRIPMVTKEINVGNGRVREMTFIPIEFTELISRLSGYTL